MSGRRSISKISIKINLKMHAFVRICVFLWFIHAQVLQQNIYIKKQENEKNNVCKSIINPDF
jgi:uncharacterized protein with PQ loop repeat